MSNTDESLRATLLRLWQKVVPPPAKQDNKPAPIHLGQGAAADAARKLRERQRQLDEI
jgi:hypothetical protein